MFELARLLGIQYQYHIAGLLIGVPVFALYLKLCWKSRNLSDCILILLSSFGVYAGADLCLIIMFSGFDECFKGTSANNIHKMYIFIGGIAVVWASSASIGRIIKAGKDDSATPAVQP